jgi:cofilin
MKQRMIYASTKDSLKKSLVGISVEVQGTDRSEVDQGEVIAKCKSVSR